MRKYLFGEACFVGILEVLMPEARVLSGESPSSRLANRIFDKRVNKRVKSAVYF